MTLAGTRLPGKPFLDIAGGWDEKVASGGCYACPAMDEEGNVLVTERNTSPIYGNNKGCDILFKGSSAAFLSRGSSVSRACRSSSPKGSCSTLPR